MFLLMGAFLLPTHAAAQYGRGQPATTLRAKPHETAYVASLEVVGEVGGHEQYRIGPDTIGLVIDVRAKGDTQLEVEYALDLGEGDPAVGKEGFSSLGLQTVQWRPAIEALTLISFFPLPEGAISVGFQWAEIGSYQIPDIDLDYAEATQFRIQSIDGDLVTISFSAEGGGSTTIDRPQLGAGSKMEITREGAREGTFVFSLGKGQVVRSNRTERVITLSVMIVNDERQQGPTETQTLTLSLWEAGAS